MSQFEQSAVSRMLRKTTTSGELRWPCLPSQCDHYLRQLDQLFSAFGFPFSADEREKGHQILASKLEEGWSISPHCCIQISWSTNDGIDYRVSVEATSIADQYADWVAHRQPPLFGKEPDARVMVEAKQISEPSTCPVLDIGAGSGRNALPLAELGFPVDALDMTPAFAGILGRYPEMPLRAIVGNVLDPQLKLRFGHYGLIICSEVTSHFRSPADLERLLLRCSEWLRPGGILVFNAFLPQNGYEPELAVREVAQAQWSSCFSFQELSAAHRSVPLQFREMTPVWEYERFHATSWPPTGWFDNWARGYDIFRKLEDQPPIQMQWLVYDRR